MSCFSSQTHFWIYTVAAPKVYHGQCLALNQTSQNSPRAKWSLNLYTSATVGIKCIRGGKKLLLPNLAGLKVFLHKVVCDLKSCFFPYFFILLHTSTMLHIARYSSGLETLQIERPIWIFPACQILFSAGFHTVHPLFNCEFPLLESKLKFEGSGH